MLLMPLMFNIAFYRILRETFVLWHSALAVSLLVTVLVSSGLSFYLGELPVMAMSAANTLLFGLSVGAAGMFARSFIEPGKLAPAAAPGVAVRQRLGGHGEPPSRRLPIRAAGGAVDAVLLGLRPGAGALHMGTRQLAAPRQPRGPLSGGRVGADDHVVGIVRLVSGLIPRSRRPDAMTLFYAGCVVEVLATTLGVADRFMAIKDERDRARTEARVLGELSERDPLTGLINRRAIERPLPHAAPRRIHSVAALDLDHFKAVNDRTVTRSAKSAEGLRRLTRRRDGQLAFRMGGEEFLLLLRGKGRSLGRKRTADGCPCISPTRFQAWKRPSPRAWGSSSSPLVQLFGELRQIYERADKLLYEAKPAGRNRIMSES